MHVRRNSRRPPWIPLRPKAWAGFWFGIAIRLWLTDRGAIATSLAEEQGARRPKVIGVADPGIFWAPYVWNLRKTGDTETAEATMPGAYFKAAFWGSSSVSLVIDGTANDGCPLSSMPVIESSIDEGPFVITPLVKTGQVYTIELGKGLSPESEHRLEVYFRASDLTQKRWESSMTHLRVAGMELDERGEMTKITRRQKSAIGFGDSITEGVGGDGLFTSWQKLEVNNARETWLPIVCSALDSEYGQLGSGGHGMSREIHLPPLTETWRLHDAHSSRLTEGRLSPEPDYIFCALGTNDFDKDITKDYLRWLEETREACPHSRFFLVIPTLGVHREEILKAAEARNQAGDARVHVIETAPLAQEFRAGQGATRLAYDGVHPTVWGQAMLGSLIAVEVRKILDREQPAGDPP